jgi:hypothetical protein
MTFPWLPMTIFFQNPWPGSMEFLKFVNILTITDIIKEQNSVRSCKNPLYNNNSYNILLWLVNWNKYNTLLMFCKISIFHDFPWLKLIFQDFQAWILEYWNSMTFQVFQDPYEPCISAHINALLCLMLNCHQVYIVIEYRILVFLHKWISANPASWLVKFDVLSCYIHLQVNTTKPKFAKWRLAVLWKLLIKKLSEIKINSVPKNTKGCKNTKTIIRLRLGVIIGEYSPRLRLGE